MRIIVWIKRVPSCLSRMRTGSLFFLTNINGLGRAEFTGYAVAQVAYPVDPPLMLREIGAWLHTFDVYVILQTNLLSLHFCSKIIVHFMLSINLNQPYN
jgi:hypothetical protein